MGKHELKKHIELLTVATLEDMDDILTEMLIIAYPTVETQKN